MWKCFLCTPLFSFLFFLLSFSSFFLVCFFFCFLFFFSFHYFLSFFFIFCLFGLNALGEQLTVLKPFGNLLHSFICHVTSTISWPALAFHETVEFILEWSKKIGNNQPLEFHNENGGKAQQEARNITYYTHKGYKRAQLGLILFCEKCLFVVFCPKPAPHFHNNNSFFCDGDCKHAGYSLIAPPRRNFISTWCWLYINARQRNWRRQIPISAVSRGNQCFTQYF